MTRLQNQNMGTNLNKYHSQVRRTSLIIKLM